MKTKMFMIASLVIAGLIFTSCQKDNALIEDLNVDQVAVKQEAPDSPKTSGWSGEHNTGDISQDRITNYPDPFVRWTTVSFTILKYEKAVSLMIYRDNYGLVSELVSGPMSAGKHEVKFDGENLPSGKYTAVLKIGAKVYNEKMTKIPFIQDEKVDPASDL